MRNHQTKPTRPCAHCGKRFTVNPRVGRRHRYCSAAACCKASRTAAQKKWLRKNGGKAYFRGTIAKSRVRDWRSKNPRYWRKGGGKKVSGYGGYVISKDLFEALRYDALQDSIDTSFALKIGLISRVTGHALQDSIALEIRSLILRGDAILRGNQPARK